MGMDAPFLSGTETSEANNGTGATFEAASAGFRNCLECVPANTDGSGFPGVARPILRAAAPSSLTLIEDLNCEIWGRSAGAGSRHYRSGLSISPATKFTCRADPGLFR